MLGSAPAPAQTSAGLDSHFYTAFRQDVPQSNAWQLESLDVFEIATPFSLTADCPAGTIPVYRLWNNRTDNDHRYGARDTCPARTIPTTMIVTLL
jgi:hypothetical protein